MHRFRCGGVLFVCHLVYLVLGRLNSRVTWRKPAAIPRLFPPRRWCPWGAGASGAPRGVVQYPLCEERGADTDDFVMEMRPWRPPDPESQRKTNPTERGVMAGKPLADLDPVHRDGRAKYETAGVAAAIPQHLAEIGMRAQQVPARLPEKQKEHIDLCGSAVAPAQDRQHEKWK